MGDPALTYRAADAPVWHNHLPGWIIASSPYAAYRQSLRLTLQAIADHCGPALPDGSLVGAIGGDALLRAAGCSRSTFWRHLRRLIGDRLVVPIGLGGNFGGINYSNEYGVPGNPTALDHRRVNRRMRHMVRGEDGKRRPVTLPLGEQAYFFPKDAGCDILPCMRRSKNETAPQNETGGSVKVRRPACQNDTSPSYGSVDGKTHGHGVSRQKGRRGKNSQLRHVTAAELRDTPALLELFADAIARGLAEDSEYERLTFVATAEYALRVGVSPPALFASLINAGWKLRFAGQDEDQARRRLEWHYHGRHEVRREISSPAKMISDVRLSEDARRVGAAQEEAVRTGYTGDLLIVLQQSAAGWTVARLQRARAELTRRRTRSRGRPPDGPAQY
jgi:hypothetical protein